jgi:O-acetyl-ADP-ribose deacetylase (regulator of RNase III)
VKSVPSCVSSDLIPIRYVTGDATCPQASGPVIIAHVCNDQGGWGCGFVLALSARWPQPEQAYRAWHRTGGTSFSLGWTQLVPVGKEEDSTWIANMIAQHGTHAAGNLPPLRYRVLGSCLRRVGSEALQRHASVHMPRIGCGLAGGRWDLVEPVIIEALSRQGVPVTVYDLPGEE